MNVDIERLAEVAGDNLHPCPKEGCPKRLRFEVFACGPHWFQLPPDIRRAMTQAWSKGDMAAYMPLREQAVAALNGK